MARPSFGFRAGRNQLRHALARVCAAALFSICFSASAVILLSTGDPTQNTTEPTRLLTGSGWQFEGSFGSFLGTPIDPHHGVYVSGSESDI